MSENHTNICPPLQVTAVHKSFYDQLVLNNISFAVEPGKVFGLIGVNGAGKTTLIKIMLDLINADSGEVSFFSVNSRIPEARSKIAYLPEKFQPTQFLKGKEFLELSLSFYGVSFDLQEAERYAVALGLSPSIFDHKLSQYSKGMGQKLGLVATFMSKAPLLILDEPMSGLDPLARIQLKLLMDQYIDNGGTIFFSSHILSDIDEICDQIAVIHNSEFVFLGTPALFKEIHQSPNLEKAFLQAITAPVKEEELV